MALPSRSTAVVDGVARTDIAGACDLPRVEVCEGAGLVRVLETDGSREPGTPSCSRVGDVIGLAEGERRINPGEVRRVVVVVVAAGAAVGVTAVELGDAIRKMAGASSCSTSISSRFSSITRHWGNIPLRSAGRTNPKSTTRWYALRAISKSPAVGADRAARLNASYDPRSVQHRKEQINDTHKQSRRPIREEGISTPRRAALPFRLQAPERLDETCRQSIYEGSHSYEYCTLPDSPLSSSLSIYNPQLSPLLPAHSPIPRRIPPPVRKLFFASWALRLEGGVLS